MENFIRGGFSKKNRNTKMEVGDENCGNLGESKERRQHGDIIGCGAGRGS
jgi:hypothetical protein